jgi:hypothetical protein
VQVVQFLDFATGSASEPHRLFESNVAAFILAPKIKTPQPPPQEPVFGNVSRGSAFTLEIAPPVGRSQDVRLLLGNRTIALPPRPLSDPPTTTSLKFQVPSDFPTGEFLVRVQVDGAQSKLVQGGAVGYTGPKVVIICNSKCLRCTNVTLNSTASGIEGLVTIQDETPAPMQDTEVSVTWTLPDESTQDDTQKTDNTGVAKFTLTGGNGKYLLTINDMTKNGLAFDQQKSTLNQSIVK